MGEKEKKEVCPAEKESEYKPQNKGLLEKHNSKYRRLCVEWL